MSETSFLFPKSPFFVISVHSRNSRTDAASITCPLELMQADNDASSALVLPLFQSNSNRVNLGWSEHLGRREGLQALRSGFSYLDKTMGEDEVIIFIAQYHWMYTAKALLFLILFWWVLGLGIYLFFSRMNKKWYHRIYITNKRFVYRQGVTNFNIVEFSKERVFGCKVERDVWSRLWGYGRVTISAGPVGEVRLSKFLKDPLGLRMALLDSQPQRTTAAAEPTLLEAAAEFET